MARIRPAALEASRRPLEIAGTVVLLGVALWYWLRYFERGANLLDEGSQAAQALRLLEGDVIYRDFFTVVTPGSYYTVAWLFEMFGTELMVMRWTVLGLGLGILLATLAAARHMIVWPFAAAAALMTLVWGWFLVAPNFYSWEAAFFSLIALVCHLRFAATSRIAWIVAAGVAAGLTILIKQNVGAYTAAASLLALWLSAPFEARFDFRQRIRSSLWLTGGAVVPVLFTIVVLVAEGAGPYLYESWIYYPLAKYPGRFSLPYPDFYPLLPELGLTSIGDVVGAWRVGALPDAARDEVWTRVVLYLPVVAYPFALVSLVVLAVRAKRGDAASARHGHALLIVTVFGLLTLLQAWPRADVTHILFGMQATHIVVAYLAWALWRGITALPGPRVAIGVVGLPIALAPHGLLLWNGYLKTDAEYQYSTVRVQLERAEGIRASGIDAQRINLITRYLTANTTPDDPIFVVPWASGFYFLADRPNPTRHDFILFEDPDAYPCVLSRLERNPPKYVIYGYVWDVDGRHFSDYAQPIDAYIRSRYTLEDSVDGYEVWRRVDGAGRAGGDWPAACAPRRFRLSDFF